MSTSTLKKTKKKFKTSQDSKNMRDGVPHGLLKSQKISETKILAALCRTSFYDFVKEFWHTVVPEKPVWGWHIRYICEVMQRAAERVFKDEDKEFDVAINISPGTSKSTICSIMFPAWVWTRMPTARFICCSHAERLALRLSRKCRDVLRSSKYQDCFPEIQLRKDQDTKGAFANTLDGERYAFGAGAHVMGNHAHFIIIDDPIDPDGVLSEVILESINSWIEDQLSGRKVNKAVTVTFLIMQRLHQSDPTAMMLKGKKIKHIKIPATTDFEIKPSSLKRFYKDVGGVGLMDPVRIPLSVIQEIRAKPRGEYVWAGQYGQDPVPPGGGMFKTKKIMLQSNIEEMPSMRGLIRYWDKAGTRSGGAFTVGVKMGLDVYGRTWILDVIRVQLDSFSRERLIKRTAIYDGKACLVGIEQEPGSGGKESTESTVRRLRGWRCRILKPTGDKEDRADPFSVQVNSGNVWMVKSHWNEDYIDELRYFPYSTYKDQVDASAGAFEILSRGKIMVGPLPRKSQIAGRSFIRQRLKSVMGMRSGLVKTRR